MSYLDNCKKIGANGGTVSTTGMTKQEKIAVDTAVNKGKPGN